MSIEKVVQAEPMATTIIDVTPDELITIARKLEAFAASAVNPGEEILLQVTSRVMLKFNPKISSQRMANKKPSIVETEAKPVPNTAQAPATRVFNA